MPGRLLTVGQLVEAAAPPAERFRPLWLRRARDLSSIGALPAVRQPHEGTGRHRLYSVDTVYLAALLFRMGDLGVPIGYLARIARLITKPRRVEREREFQAFWREAKAMTNPQDAHIAIQPAPGVGTFYEKSFGPIAVKDGAWAVINLTHTFRQLRL
jgi:hypothetical protein